MNGNKKTITEALKQIGRSEIATSTSNRKKAVLKTTQRRSLTTGSYTSEKEMARKHVRKYWKDANKVTDITKLRKEAKKNLSIETQILLDYRAGLPLKAMIKKYKINEKQIFQILNGEDED